MIFNQIFISAPLIYLAYRIQLFLGIPDIRVLPTFQRIIIDVLVCILFEEVIFYYSHRMLHAKFIYKTIHKKHHEWQAPISIIAIYCHPIEHMFSNLLPIIFGLWVMRSHLFTCWLWFTIAILNTLKDHSGYHFPFFTSSEFHDYHHLKYFWMLAS